MSLNLNLLKVYQLILYIQENYATL